MDQAGSACAWCEFACVAECHGWPGPPRHELTWLSIKLTPVDILPKPTASTRPWRVHHLQACHGPAGAQLHLQDTCEIRGPATGDVEEDGGLSDNVQTRKTIPTVCRDPPCHSWCLPLFLLWERWLALRWPQAPSAGSLRPELCPHCRSQGWGRISYQVWAWGLLDSMPELRKQQGPWGLCPFAAVCSKRITVSSNPTWH